MKIVYIEGADGIGKTTMIEKMCEKLEKLGFRVYSTKEPDYCIRRALLSNNPNRKEFHYYCQRLMMATSHIQKLSDLIGVKNSGDYDIAIIDRTSVISDYVYGAMLNMDKNYNLVFGAVEPIMTEVNSEIKDISTLVLANLENDEFEARLHTRASGIDINDSTDMKRRVKEKYDEAIYEIRNNRNFITERLFRNHFKNIIVTDIEDTGKAADDIIKQIVAEEI